MVRFDTLRQAGLKTDFQPVSVIIAFGTELLCHLLILIAEMPVVAIARRNVAVVTESVSII